jgi:hypothetical protein
MFSEDCWFTDEIEMTFAMPVPQHHRVAYLNYSCLPRAP